MNDTNLLDDLIESVFVFFVSYKTSVCSIEPRLNGRSRVETKFRGLPVAPVDWQLRRVIFHRVIVIVIVIIILMDGGPRWLAESAFVSWRSRGESAASFVLTHTHENRTCVFVKEEGDDTRQLQLALLLPRWKFANGSNFDRKSEQKDATSCIFSIHRRWIAYRRSCLFIKSSYMVCLEDIRVKLRWFQSFRSPR